MSKRKPLLKNNKWAWILHFPGGQESNDSATESETKKFKSPEAACQYLIDIYPDDEMILALSEKRFKDVVQKYNDEVEDVSLKRIRYDR